MSLHRVALLAAALVCGSRATGSGSPPGDATDDDEPTLSTHAFFLSTTFFGDSIVEPLAIRAWSVRAPSYRDTDAVTCAGGLARHGANGSSMRPATTCDGAASAVPPPLLSAPVTTRHVASATSFAREGWVWRPRDAAIAEVTRFAPASHPRRLLDSTQNDPRRCEVGRATSPTPRRRRPCLASPCHPLDVFLTPQAVLGLARACGDGAAASPAPPSEANTTPLVSSAHSTSCTRGGGGDASGRLAPLRECTRAHFASDSGRAVAEARSVAAVTTGFFEVETI